MAYLLPHLNSGWAVDQVIPAVFELFPPFPVEKSRIFRVICRYFRCDGTQQAILNEEERVVVIRFGHDWDVTCMQVITAFPGFFPPFFHLFFCSFLSGLGLVCQMDEVLAGIAEDVKNFAVIYCVDITEVPDFNTMYELYDPCTVMFFFRNKHIMVDLGEWKRDETTGNQTGMKRLFGE